MTSLLVSILHRIFRCKYSNFRDVVASRSFLYLSRRQRARESLLVGYDDPIRGWFGPIARPNHPTIDRLQEVTTIAYESWSFTRVSNCSELILQNFSILGWRWSGARGGCLWRFDCSQFSSSALMERITFTANGKRRQIQVENFSKKKMSA